MSFEDECKEFEEWFRKEYERVEAIPVSGGLDGQRSVEGSKFSRKAVARAKEIAKKYNREYNKTIGQILDGK